MTLNDEPNRTDKGNADGELPLLAAGQSLGTGLLLLGQTDCIDDLVHLLAHGLALGALEGREQLEMLLDRQVGEQLQSQML